MSEAFSFPSWLTAICLLVLVIVFIVTKAKTSKRKLTQWDVMNSVGQALLALSAIITGINLICLGTAEEVNLPHTLIEPVHPLISSGFFVLALGLWVIYENVRRLRKKR